MKRIVLLITVSILLTSCKSLILTYAAYKLKLKQDRVYIKKLNVPYKQVYFLGMKHIGTKKYYKNCSIVINNYKQNEYAFYVETIQPYKDDIPYQDSTAQKKIRKILGVDLTISYAEMNDTIMKLLVKKFKLIDQPRYFNLGVANGKIADLSYIELVKLYEAKYGEIILDSCDTNTALGKKYSCRTLSKEKRDAFDKEFILEARNKKVAEIIKNSEENKIVIIFGIKHYEGIKKELEILEIKQ